MPANEDRPRPGKIGPSFAQQTLSLKHQIKKVLQWNEMQWTKIHSRMLQLSQIQQLESAVSRDVGGGEFSSGAGRGKDENPRKLTDSKNRQKCVYKAIFFSEVKFAIVMKRSINAFSFASTRPAGFVNSHEGGARPAFCGAGQPIFPRGGAGRPSLLHLQHFLSQKWYFWLSRILWYLRKSDKCLSVAAFLKR